MAEYRLKTVDKIPEKERHNNDALYEILDRFNADSKPAQEVIPTGATLDDKSAFALSNRLKHRVHTRQYKVDVVRRGNHVYLVKLEEE